MPCARHAKAPWVEVMGVTAHDGHTRQRSAVLGSDHMHDTLPLVLEREVSQRTDFADIAVEGLDLLTGNRILNTHFPMIGWRVVVGRCDDGVHAPRLAPGQLEPFEGLRAGDFVDQMTVDVDQRSAVILDVHHVARPQFFVKRLHGRSRAEGGKNFNYFTGLAC